MRSSLIRSFKGPKIITGLLYFTENRNIVSSPFSYTQLPSPLLQYKQQIHEVGHQRSQENYSLSVTCRLAQLHHWWRRLKWPGHVDRMGDVKLTQKADAQKVEGKGRGGRQRLRREEIGRRKNGEQQQKIVGIGDFWYRR